MRLSHLARENLRSAEAALYQADRDIANEPADVPFQIRNEINIVMRRIQTIRDTITDIDNICCAKPCCADGFCTADPACNE